jgi:nucleotide-binding universal stress UspA family protein
MHNAIKKILVATDGSRDSALAVGKAASMVRVFGAELHVVHVVGVSQAYSLADEDLVDTSFYEEDFQGAQDLLEKEAKKIEEAGGSVTEIHLKTGEPDAEVVELAEEIGADLLLVGSRGRNPLGSPPIGSVSSSIATHAHCPVMVVREYESGERARGKSRAEDKVVTGR